GRGPAPAVPRLPGPAQRRGLGTVNLDSNAGRGAGGRCPGPGQGVRIRSCLLVLGQHALDLEGERDLLADGNAATGDRAVVADAEVAPVDLAAGREARPGAAVGVRA